MSTPLIEFCGKHDMVLEIYKGVGGIAFWTHPKGKTKGIKIWLSIEQCEEMIETLDAWISFFENK